MNINNQLSLLPEPGKTMYQAVKSPSGKIWVLRCEVETEVDNLLEFHKYVNKKHAIKNGAQLNYTISGSGNETN